MSYLYGDSTPSPLEVNFVDFLGDCLDFCAHRSWHDCRTGFSAVGCVERSAREDLRENSIAGRLPTSEGTSKQDVHRCCEAVRSEIKMRALLRGVCRGC